MKTPHHVSQVMRRNHKRKSFAPAKSDKDLDSGGIIDTVLELLDETPTSIHAKIGLDVRDMTGMSAAQAVAVDYDYRWYQLNEFINERIAQLMAARGEIQRKLSADRKRRAINLQRQLAK